jgi:ferredoxin-NADP reductase
MLSYTSLYNRRELMPDALSEDRKNVCRVVKVIRETQDIASILMEKPDSGFSTRKAGQFASIRIRMEDGWSKPHPFTLSCAPEEDLLRLTIKKEGSFTTAIHEIQPGTEVKCMGPLGIFCKDIDAKPMIIMLGGGVGITPFLSVLRHLRNIHAKNQIKLFWVNRTVKEIFCAEEIKEMTRVLDLKIVHSLSREEDVSSCFEQKYPHIFYEKGRLSVDILKRHEVSMEAAFYLCGPPPMMESALLDLNSMGVEPASVEKESFSW